MVISKTSKESLLPFGKEISAVSPTVFPKRPLAMGVFTEIFPCFKSLSLSGTKVNFCSALVVLFFSLTVVQIETLEVSIWSSSMILEVAMVSCNFAIFISKSP